MVLPTAVLRASVRRRVATLNIQGKPRGLGQWNRKDDGRQQRTHPYH